MDDDLKAVGSRIRIIRKALKLTQEDVAERIEIEPKSLGRIEMGANLPSLKTLNKLAAVLDVSISDFFAKPDKTLSVPATLKEMRAHLYDFIANADETTVVRWYRESQQPVD